MILIAVDSSDKNHAQIVEMKNKIGLCSLSLVQLLAELHFETWESVTYKTVTHHQKANI